MRFVLVCLVAVLAAAAAFTVPDYTGYTYTQFLSEFRGKLGANVVPCPARKAVFEANLAKIKAHNAQGRSWYMAVNEHADMTEEEFLAFYTQRNPKSPARNDMTYALRQRSEFSPLFRPRKFIREEPDVPVSADWSHTIGASLTQGQCGSCWAFGTSHTLLGRSFIASGKHISVSPQQLTSCTPNPRHCGGTGGCRGATFQLAADYLIGAGFLTTEKAYPYVSGTTEETGECEFDESSMPRSLSISGYVNLQRNNKTALLEQIAEGGPVSVSVAASAWFLYGGGIYDQCTKNGDAVINHIVSATGYDLKAGFIRIINSWGPSWGEKGSMRLKLYDEEPVQMNDSPLDGSGCEDESTDPVEVAGECGIFFDSAYPTGLKVYS
jgi:cathepsin L